MFEDDYTAEAIIGKKEELGKLKFLVKWRGYPQSEATWCAHATCAAPTAARALLW